MGRRPTAVYTAAPVATAPANGTVSIPKLQNALVLHRYFCQQLGADSFTALQKKLHDVPTGTNDDGLTHWYHTLYAVAGLKLKPGKLAEYDRRVTGYVTKLNVNRTSPRIVLTYYQWLSLIFTEMFLDRLFSDEKALRQELNAAVARLNAGTGFANLQNAYTGRGGWLYPSYASETDLHKAAFWMATGSGKTILMHIHLWQWRHYANPKTQNGGILLITPSESLSRQHLNEFRASGIAASRYEDANASGSSTSTGDGAPVIVIEVQKLKDKKKGGGKSVAVSEFEAFGLILVDEGHRGASGEEWREIRRLLGQNALTLEYSATFGQTVNGATATKKPGLLSEYAAAILFDFSYPHFYADGYGKDYAILNSNDDTVDFSDWVLLSNLLSYYEQRLAYTADPEALRVYNIEPPLWILVGNSVTGGRTRDEEATLSDVQAVVRFFARFLSDRDTMSTRIVQLLAGNHPLKDGNERDLLQYRFPLLRKQIYPTPVQRWAKIVETVFQASGNETLVAVELKTAKGEIGLRAGAGNPYFGVINIGDVAGLRKLLEAQGITMEDDAVGAGLFNDLNKPDSKVNVLIGSRKFMEGWDSFRVSSMGLLNIGQGEGSQIIQLFGRGVRLRGKNYTLKRSAFLKDETTAPPANLRLLETLNVFGVRASYMAKFRESLQNEGITTDVEEIEIPIRLSPDFEKHNLQVLLLEGTFTEPVALAVEDGIKINIDLRPRVESAIGGQNDFIAEDAAGTEQTRHLRKFSSLLDWNRITRLCMNFRRDKNLHSLAFDTAVLQTVFLKANIVIQSTPEYFAGSKFSGLARIEDTVVTALTKYIAVFHERRRKEWETRNLRLKPLTADHKNLNFGAYTVKVSTEKKSVADRVTKIVEEAKAIYEQEMTAADGLPAAHISNHLYQPLLRKWDALENIKPAGMEDSEADFIDDLREYLRANPQILQDRELFLLRNQVTYGIVFYDETGSGFFPDFLLWIVESNGSQTLCFVDPHGIMHEPLNGAKIQLWRRLRDEITPCLKQNNGRSSVKLDAFILAPTHANDLKIPIIADNLHHPNIMEENHVLFQKSSDDGPPDYIGRLLHHLIR